ncbi:hypothetical protein FOCC_FOCC014269 [Frankliniella occidentalis]|nr:hypothetical protein FOCC_FOCC014269 [Frankliniella occidentalis]
MSVKTRHQTEVWLIGQPLESLTCSKLPTTGQLLRRFLYIQGDRSEGQKTLRECARLTIEEALPYWQKCGVPVQQMKDAIETFLTFHTEWTKLKKNKGRTENQYVQVREHFKATLENTYDLARVDAEEIMTRNIAICKNEKERNAMTEDLKFYKLQMDSRVGSMIQRDMDVVKKCKKQQRVMQTKEELKKKYEENKAKTSESFKKIAWHEVKTEEINDEGETKEVRDQEFNYNEDEHRKKRLKVKSADRNNLTDRSTARLIQETATALGHDTSKITLSRSTLKRRREENRRNVIENFADTFTPKGPIVIHWDGKLLPDEQGQKIDRLPVVVKDLETGEEQLLGVAALKSGSGKAQQSAVVELAVARQVDSHIVGMSFDTTSSNTGQYIGACVLLEESLGRTLIRLACRHHVLELPVKGGFDALAVASTSPVTALFERFSKFWEHADQNLQLSDFANKGSLNFFKKLKVEPEFLSLELSEWENNFSYKTVEKFVRNLPSTNDAAERGVALAKKFNNVLTKNEDQKQGLYVVVANDRKSVLTL